MLFLQSWWSRTYNRPLKDPILKTYTLEELLYEYYDHKEREDFSKEKQEEETDKIEEAKFDEALKWAEEEEARDSKKDSIPDIAEEDKKWMEQKIKEDEQFAEDIVEEF